MATLHIIHGFIGFGKTTFSKKLTEEKGIIRFNNDEWMVKLYGTNPDIDKIDEYWNNINDIQMDMIKKLLNSGNDVVFDNGMWRRCERDNIREFCKRIGAKYKFYKLECDKDTAKARTLRRNFEGSESIFVSEETFEDKWRFFEPMSLDEDFISI
jgi:predicted kinase